jgi:membrane-bound serine protease (ClpP class)
MKVFNMLFVMLVLSVYMMAQDTIQTKSDTPKKIYVFDIKEEIAKPAFLNVQKAFREATEMQVDIIIIHLNTYGGLVDMADSIRTSILNSPIPVWVFIDNNAASAGALISIACDSIYMRKGANIGAATVVTQDAQALPDKYQSYMRSMMRSTAEAKGRDPQIAQAMVDPDVFVEGVSDSGKVLTLTTSEAIALGFCEGQAESIEEVLQIAGIENYEIVKQELTPIDNIRRFLVSPLISGLLIMIIIGGLYFELQTPGIGFPLGAAIIAALLYFAPLYIEGIASQWEIIVFIIGVVLLAVEVFVLPGFGVAGILGIILVVASLAFGMVETDGFIVPKGNFDQLAKAFAIVIISMFLGLISSFYIAQKTLKSRFLSHLALNTEESTELGYTSANLDLKKLIGTEALTATLMMPSGKIEIDGEYYDASVETGYIEKGETVVITKYESMQLFVRKKTA